MNIEDHQKILSECHARHKKELESLRQQLASRDAEVAELKGANVLNRNALRLQKEKADQLREQVKMLRDALTRIRDRPLVNDVVHKIASEALAATVPKE